MKDIIPVDYLRECLNYCPISGSLIWADRPESHFFLHRAFLHFKKRHAGKPALTAVSGNGYRQGTITFYGLKVDIRAHIAAWTIGTGAWPDGQIDHINGDKLDNRLSNLREVSNVENGRNQKLRNTNVSGINGVHWRKDTSKWSACICVDGKTKHLGSFENIEDAARARAAADLKYGFHSNHGRDGAVIVRMEVGLRC